MEGEAASSGMTAERRIQASAFGPVLFTRCWRGSGEQAELPAGENVASVCGGLGAKIDAY
ncbi:MAG: hypothetical protein AMXMBFR58_26550 [Phycisphaerae bacterium]|nr:hypothetical protein [Phycisphaerales bacterium]